MEEGDVFDFDYEMGQPVGPWMKTGRRKYAHALHPERFGTLKAPPQIDVTKRRRAAEKPPRKKNPKRSRSEKKLDKEIEQAWYRLAEGVQVSVMDIPRIFRDVKLEMAAGMSVDEAVVTVREQYRKNPLTHMEAGQVAMRGLHAARKGKREVGAAYMEVARDFGPRRGNPPAHFVIDPTTNEILYISRVSKGDWAGDVALRKAGDRAMKEAKKRGHKIVTVVHPYVPSGFKAGVRVSPLFYHYGAVEWTAEGSRRHNPRKRKGKANSTLAKAQREVKELRKAYQENPMYPAVGAAAGNPRMTKKAQAYISKKARKLYKEGYTAPGQAAAIAYKYAREKGYKVAKRRKKKRGRNPGLPAEIENDPKFQAELKSYRKRHGAGPIEIKKIRVPKGFPRYMSAYGNSPDVKYDAPKTSNKGKRIHRFGKKGKGKPFLVSSVEKGPKFLAYAGGEFRAETQWIHD